MTLQPWFVAQLKPQGAALALVHLERQGFEAFLPRRRISQRRQNRFQQTLEPLFPGYVFVSFNPEDPAARCIRSTRGISRVVGSARGPSALPPGFVPALRARCDAQGLILPEPDLTEGGSVRILTGPFAGLVGTILSAGADQRIRVLLSLLGSERAVALDRASLGRA